MDFLGGSDIFFAHSFQLIVSGGRGNLKQGVKSECETKIQDSLYAWNAGHSGKYDRELARIYFSDCQRTHQAKS